MQENWEHLIKTYGSGFLITRFVSAAVSPVCLIPLYNMLCPIGFLSILEFPSGMFDYNSPFLSLVQFASFEKAKEVEDFFASHATPSIARTLRQSLERVNINASWVESVRKEDSLADAVKELAYRKY